MDKKWRLVLMITFSLLLVFCEYILFSLWQGERDFKKALDYLNKARPADPGLIVQKSLSYKNALRLLDSSSKLNPLDARPYFEYAQALSEIGEDARLSGILETESLTGAKTKFIKAILREPANAIYHQRLGAVYVKLSEFQKAEKEFDNAVLLDGQNIRLRLYLSQYFFSRDKKGLALFHLHKAVALYKVLPAGPLSNEVEAFVKGVGQEGLLKK